MNTDKFAYDGLENYLKGRLCLLMGNTMFWRVSFEEGIAMECRKFGKVLVGVLKPKLGSFIIAMTLSEGV